MNDGLEKEDEKEEEYIVINPDYYIDEDKLTAKEDKVEKDDEITLYDFLNGLSAEQQRAALVQLSVMWAEKQTNMKMEV